MNVRKILHPKQLMIFGLEKNHEHKIVSWHNYLTQGMLKSLLLHSLKLLNWAIQQIHPSFGYLLDHL
jgi:hypothetical protein